MKLVSDTSGQIVSLPFRIPVPHFGAFADRSEQ